MIIRFVLVHRTYNCACQMLSEDSLRVSCQRVASVAVLGTFEVASLGSVKAESSSQGRGAGLTGIG